jgi:hypothetical protein
MKINLFKFERLENQKCALKEKLGLPADIGLDIAFDGIHALNDLSRSIANLHPHKRSIAILGSQPPPIQKLISGFGGEGFGVQHLPVSFAIPNETALAEAWEKLKKDTLFILSIVAEPLTGALYPVEWVRRESQKKGFFNLLYFSPDSLKRGLPIPQSPWEAFVLDPLWNKEHTLAVTLKGDRAKGDPILWGEPHFSEEALEILSNSLSSGQADLEDEKTVRSFEKQLAALLKTGVRLLGEECPRLFDRAVIFIEGINGEALQNGLAKQGIEIHTGASCAWDDPHTNNWLPQLGLGEEMIQASVLVPLSTLKTAGLIEKILPQIIELRKVSGYR